jgi:hypothetical protein
MVCDCHTIVLAVIHLLGHFGILCREAKHPKHTFTMSQKSGRTLQAQEESWNEISVFQKHGLVGLGGKHIDSWSCVPRTCTPILNGKNTAQGAHNRIQRLDKAVDLSPDTFSQYQSLKAKKLWKEMATEDKMT